MKLTLLLFAVLALANPMAEPIPNDEIAAPVADELVPRQINSGCTVSGKGNLNVYVFLLPELTLLIRADFYREGELASGQVNVLLSVCRGSARIVSRQPSILQMLCSTCMVGYESPCMALSDIPAIKLPRMSSAASSNRAQRLIPPEAIVQIHTKVARAGAS